MDFSYDENQTMLRDSVSRFIAQDYDFDTRQEIVQGVRDNFWPLFAELGWLMVPFPEELGGLGGSAVDLLAVMEELGKGLVVEPYLPTAILAGGILVAADEDPRCAELVEQLIGGELQLALAFAEPGSRYELANVATSAVQDGDDYVLNGHKAVVLNAAAADRIIVVARTAGERRDRNGINLFLLDAGMPGLRLNAYATVDGQQAAEVFLDDLRVPSTAMIAVTGSALPLLEQVIDRATLALCADALGAMGVIFQKTLEYTKLRKQFGVPIASFQALQHRMAEMFIEFEQARSITMMAAMQLDKHGSDPAAVSAAKSRVGRAAQRIGEESIQLHGGIGVTEELDVGHYFKRLTVLQYQFGSTDFHTARYSRCA